MNRRGFLSFLGAAAVAPLVSVPELLLPTKTIFLPPAGGWLSGRYDVRIDVGPHERYSNRLLTPDEMSREIATSIEEFLSGSQWSADDVKRLVLRNVPRLEFNKL